jgi:hypothetical protein
MRVLGGAAGPEVDCTGDGFQASKAGVGQPIRLFCSAEAKICKLIDTNGMLQTNPPRQLAASMRNVSISSGISSGMVPPLAR